VKGIIEERRSAGSCNKGDFLDVLLSMTNELSDEEKVSFVLDSLLGGYETTSLLISMVVYFLGQSAEDLDLVKVRNTQCLFTVMKAQGDCWLLGWWPPLNYV
jgi:cytochrome P450 family 724 subfamily B1